MGMDLELSDWQYSQEQREQLLKPSTHFAKAHEGNKGFLVFQNGEFVECTIGRPYNDEAVFITYPEEDGWHRRLVEGAAYIDNVFVGSPNGLDRKTAFETINLSKLPNLPAHQARKKAQLFKHAQQAEGPEPSPLI